MAAYKINGKCYEESSGKTDRGKAEKVLARREAELGLGHFVAPDVKRATVDDLAQMLRDDYRVNGRRSFQPLANDVVEDVSNVGSMGPIHPDVGATPTRGAAPASHPELSADHWANRLVRGGSIPQIPRTPQPCVSPRSTADRGSRARIGPSSALPATLQVPCLSRGIACTSHRGPRRASR